MRRQCLRTRGEWITDNDAEFIVLVLEGITGYGKRLHAETIVIIPASGQVADFGRFSSSKVWPVSCELLAE